MMPKGIKFLSTIFFVMVLLFSTPIAEAEPLHGEIPQIAMVAQPVKLEVSDPFVENEIRCLTTEIYREASDQPDKGQIAVAEVVMNRLKSRRFGDSVCEIIHAKKKGVCQFTWVCERQHRTYDPDAWQDAKRIARKVYSDEYPDNTKGALYFHKKTMCPSWAKAFKRVLVVGDHVFLKERL